MAQHKIREVRFKLNVSFHGFAFARRLSGSTGPCSTGPCSTGPCSTGPCGPIRSKQPPQGRQLPYVLAIRAAATVRCSSIHLQEQVPAHAIRPILPMRYVPFAYWVVQDVRGRCNDRFLVTQHVVVTSRLPE